MDTQQPAKVLAELLAGQVLVCDGAMGGSHKQSARMLHLHTNTVAYRVARIEAITGLALGDPDDRLVAHVAVKIIESQGSTE